MNEKLIELLQDAWHYTNAGKQTIDFLDVYNLYEDADQEERDEITSEYARGLAIQRIAVPKPSPDPVLQTLPPNPILEKLRKEKPREAPVDKSGLPVGGGLDLGKGGYIWFASPRFQDNGARERVVLHVCPYELVVMTWDVLAKKVMTAEGRFSGVNSGKYMKLDCYQSGRHDTIIIYTKDKTTRDAVLFEVKRLIAVGKLKQGQFISPLPKGLKEDPAGIGFGSEPPNVQLLDSYQQKPSYGKYLGETVSIAISIAVATGVNKWLDFQRLAAYVLMMVGFDPAEPHNIHDMSPPLAASIPWPEPESGTLADDLQDKYREWVTDTDLYKAILKERILK